MRIGRQTRIPSAGQNRKVPVFGALDPSNGRLTAGLLGGKNSACFILFLKRLLLMYPGKHIFLFLDNCSIHHAKAVMRFTADHSDRLTFIWNATYAPQLNLIERYWGHLKAKAIHNYFFETREKLERAIRDAVHAMNRSRKIKMSLHLHTLNSLFEAA